MSETLYVVSYSWYEDYDPTIIRGPVVDDWEAFCRELLPQAAERAMSEVGGDWCGWPAITAALVSMLTERGYVVVKPDEFRTWGSLIIDSDDDAKGLPADIAAKIIARNIEKREDLNARARRRLAEREAP
jgi:hypothetical protein